MSNQKATPRMELVRVVMTPLGSAASNVFNMLNMMFFLTFCTEALNLNVVVVGVVMTAMRLFDGITDPIIGNIIDLLVPLAALAAMVIRLCACAGFTRTAT